jgi:hypothetical protein
MSIFRLYDLSLIFMAVQTIITGALAQSGRDKINTRRLDQVMVQLFGKEKEQMC